MKLNWATKIVDVYGHVYQQPKMRSGAEEKDAAGKSVLEDVTLAIVCIAALVSQLQGDENSSGVDKMSRTRLAEKIVEVMNQDAEVVMTVEDVADLKKRINLTGYAPVIVARAWRMLDAAEEQKTEH